MLPSFLNCRLISLLENGLLGIWHASEKFGFYAALRCGQWQCSIDIRNWLAQATAQERAKIPTKRTGLQAGSSIQFFGNCL
jgi:hypothetical protein